MTHVVKELASWCS